MKKTVNKDDSIDRLSPTAPLPVSSAVDPEKRETKTSAALAARENEKDHFPRIHSRIGGEREREEVRQRPWGCMDSHFQIG